LQERHDILIKLEHLHTRIRNKKVPEREGLCELLELLELVVFDVYEEMERLNGMRCGLMQKAMCTRGEPPAL
jgi:hypothetical protein